MPILSQQRMTAFAFILGFFPCFQNVNAMTLEQMKTLEGTILLDLRVKDLFQQCSLPSVIEDVRDASSKTRQLQWGNVKMQLSPKSWKITYSPKKDLPVPEQGWRNPGDGSVTCLKNLPALVVHAKGDVGFLATKLRADKKGYTTSYDIPEDLYVAHQVIGITGSWEKGLPVSRIKKQYGKPDEVLDSGEDISTYRYWVVVTEKNMPGSVYAVDFEIRHKEKFSIRYTVQTRGFKFVQEKFDSLMHQWVNSNID